MATRMVSGNFFAAGMRWIALLMLAWCVLGVFPRAARAAAFQVSVRVANAQGHIKRAYVYDASGCHGQNHVPSVHWSNPPIGTRSYAITVHDPDAAGGWWHWIVVDIPADARTLGGKVGLPRGALALRNSFGKTGWGGPCPPVGDPSHHYVFSVYALDAPALGLAANATAAQAMASIHAHQLAVARVVYMFGR